jgi:hypothetical protein
MKAPGKIVRGLYGITLLLSLLTACAPGSFGGAALESPKPVPAETGGVEASRQAAPGDGTAKPSTAPVKGARLFSQAEVETLAGLVTGPGGSAGEVLTGGQLWDENQSLHFGAGAARVSPAECSDVLAWAMLMSAGLPAAGTFSGTSAEPAFVVVSADRDAALALAFPSIFQLPDCSPARLTVADGSFTATYHSASAFTDADQTYAVIATIIRAGRQPAHFLRVAAKNGTLFVQATMPLADPGGYRDEANRLTGYINQVVHGEQQLLDGADVGPAPTQEPPAGGIRT